MKLRHLLAGASLLTTIGCGFGSSCIAAGARIRTPRGLRRIEDLCEGDEVYCFDPLNEQLAPAKLTAIRTATRECVRLHFAGGTLTCTSDHPLFSPSTNEWAPAGDWVQGKRTHLLRVREQKAIHVAVERAETFVGLAQVYDLTVDHPLHNFIADDVLVHNKSVRLTCTAPDGGLVYSGEPCRCSEGGTGIVACRSQTFCEECPSPDGGAADAGESADGGDSPDAGG